ncbi:MAG: ABC transporter substrate-binding protein [Methylococcales bacterium]|nr:ABC transporter substrate-binding protein [Methylococcales bacterium]
MSRSLSLLCLIVWLLTGCGPIPANHPYPDREWRSNTLYSSFSERPKHLDPARAYSANEYVFIAQIYEPLLQYHYLKRPYQLTPLTAEKMPEVVYRAKDLSILPDATAPDAIAFTDYLISVKPGIDYQPHPAFAKTEVGDFLYHDLSDTALAGIASLADFEHTGTRELIAEDYIFQIKRLAHVKTQSPIAELMKNYIEGFAEFQQQTEALDAMALRDLAMTGVEALDRYHLRIRIKGKYPQFKYWLAMPFFAPMPWEAVAFYQQPGLSQKNIVLDWYPIGTGPYQLTENNPNRRMILSRNPNFHGEAYPSEGEAGDLEAGLLADAGKAMPFIDRVVYTLEKETIPYWNKFLQGYYDASGIAADSFDQAVQFSSTGELGLTQDMRDKGIALRKVVATSIYYVGFNMLDKVVGGNDAHARLLRQAIAIAMDYEEFISIFLNGRGRAAQGLLPPGIFGYVEGQDGINPYVYDWVDNRAKRKSLTEAKALLAKAGYPEGIDPDTGQALILYLDTPSTSSADRPRMNWYRKQLQKLGIKLVIRGTDYNRFQQKMRSGNTQIFMWGWNADYPDPENFFFLLYGPNGKVEHGGENAGNYQNKQFDRLFEKMRVMDNSPERFQLIQKMQALIRRDTPWIFGLFPEDYLLAHAWYGNIKANLMANNRLKYQRIDPELRATLRQQWNQPARWPALIFGLLVLATAYAAWRRYLKQRER